MAYCWFSSAFGFREGRTYAENQKRLLAQYDEKSNTLANMSLGQWKYMSLADLRAETLSVLAKHLEPAPQMSYDLRQMVGEAGALHHHPASRGCTFQAASQFNCLEFIGPHVVPEDGITIYENDHTQGPACAIACPAATAFRNYLVNMPSKDGVQRRGQTQRRQLNGIQDLHAHLQSLYGVSFWEVQNGYMDSTENKLAKLNEALLACSTEERNALKDKICVGAHIGTHVVADSGDEEHLVGQVFCAAPAVAYSHNVMQAHMWRFISTLILESAYESTLWATLLNHYTSDGPKPDHPTVFLTKLGGGVFGNEAPWIISSMKRSIERVSKQCKYDTKLRARVVHFRDIEQAYEVLDNHSPPTPGPAGPPGWTEAGTAPSSEQKRRRLHSSRLEGLETQTSGGLAVQLEFMENEPSPPRRNAKRRAKKA